MLVSYEFQKLESYIFSMSGSFLCSDTTWDNKQEGEEEKESFLFLSHFPNLHSQKFSVWPHGNQGCCFWSLLQTFL